MRRTRLSVAARSRFCRESRLRRPPFHPHHRAPTISQRASTPLPARGRFHPPPLPAAGAHGLVAPSRSSCLRLSRGFIPLSPGSRARDLVFSSSLPALASRTARTPLLGHTYVVRTRTPGRPPEDPRFYSAPPFTRDGPWGRAGGLRRPSDSICSLAKSFFS